MLLFAVTTLILCLMTLGIYSSMKRLQKNVEELRDQLEAKESSEENDAFFEDVKETEVEQPMLPEGEQTDVSQPENAAA
jgi:cell division protein FtsL